MASTIIVSRKQQNDTFSLLRESVCHTGLNRLVTNEAKYSCLTIQRFISCVPPVSHKLGDPIRQRPTNSGLMNPGFLHLMSPPSQHMSCRTNKEGEEKTRVMLDILTVSAQKWHGTSVHNALAITSHIAPIQLQRRMQGSVCVVGEETWIFREHYLLPLFQEEKQSKNIVR